MVNFSEEVQALIVEAFKAQTINTGNDGTYFEKPDVSEAASAWEQLKQDPSIDNLLNFKAKAEVCQKRERRHFDEIVKTIDNAIAKAQPNHQKPRGRL